MKMPTWTKPAIFFAGPGLALALAAGCSDNNKLTPSAPTPSPDASSAQTTPCTAMPGQFPAANCDNSTNQCTGGGCAINEATCGSASTCLPMSDNTGKPTIDLRMRRLNVASPAALAANAIQLLIVDQGINLNKVCGESGDGSFNWLLRVDKAAGTLTTGGAPPSADPFGAGFCFAKTTSMQALSVAPVTVGVTFAGNTFTSAAIPKLNVPIFVNGDRTQLVVLPLSNATLKDVTLSADNNCVGAFNAQALDSTCHDQREVCSRWHTAGSLGGYITLEEADRVPIVTLGGKSLCTFLTGMTDASGQRCPRDATNKITFQGDFCSTTNTAGGCADSAWLAATFAASAVKIDDASSDPLCTGSSSSSDAGADASDAGAGDSGAATTDASSADATAE